MTNPSTTILLEADKVTVTSINNKGIKTVTNTNLESVQQVLMQEQAFETELLPSQWGVVKYYKKNRYEGIVLTTPPTIRTVNMNVSDNEIPKELKLPIPPMIWVFEILNREQNSRVLTHSMCYVLKHELISMKDKVFHAPYPNIGINHGICWGRDLPPVPTAKSLQNVPARFFTQPFNFDLANNRVKNFDFVYPTTGTEVKGTSSAVFHMVNMAELLKKSEEEGAPFVYPFDTLKQGTLTVNNIVRNTLPGIFS